MRIHTTIARAGVLALVAALAVVAPAAADQVVADDEIVQGNLCAGFDCVNDEAFGTDTVRVKENSTRLAFADTSTGLGDPGNDWELTANDQSSGGQSYLGVRDVTSSRVGLRIAAGVPSDTVLIAPGVIRLTRGVLTQREDGTSTENRSAADSDALLTALSSLALSTYHGTTDPSPARRIGPLAAAFNAAFGVGAGNDLATGDEAGVALAVMKGLTARVAAASPGPRGPAGAKGTTGAKGPAGDRGPSGKEPAGGTPTAAQIADFNRRLSALGRRQATISKANGSLARQIREEQLRLRIARARG
jgi:hypothetical protein